MLTANDNTSAIKPRTCRANIADELGTFLFVSVPEMRDAIVGRLVGRVEKGRVVIRGKSALGGMWVSRRVPVADLERA